MAGIGFKLKKLFVEGSYISNVAAYFYSSVVIVGPMLICISIILLAKYYLKLLGAEYVQIETLTATIVYSFIFSMILTGGLAFITSRYVSDCLFSNELDHILHSYNTMQALAAALAAVLAAAFLLRSPLDFPTKALTYLLFVTLSCIWIDMIYITAFKEYMSILVSFGSGLLVMVAGGLALTKLTDLPPALAVLLSIAAGFMVLHAMMIVHIRSFFHTGRPASRRKGILSYLGKHKLLLVTGFLLTAAPYVHNFVFWFSPYGVNVSGTYQYCPGYDIPSFYAMLTVIPTIVMFVVNMETKFYSKYRNYYFLILNEGIVHEIRLARKEMEETLFSQLAIMMEVQIMISFLLIVVGIYLLSLIGFTTLFTNTFTGLALGSLAYIFLDVVVLILLYFNDVGGAFAFAAAFFSLNILFSAISVRLGTDFFGYGYFLSGFLCMAGGLVRLFYYVKNINYLTYCTQPLVSNSAEPSPKPVEEKTQTVRMQKNA